MRKRGDGAARLNLITPLAGPGNPFRCFLPPARPDGDPDRAPCRLHQCPQARCNLTAG